MRIALLTYFAADNYGATLQAYATIKAFEREGHKVELVNYVIPEPENPLFKRILLFPKHLKFKSFRKKYFKNITSRYNSIHTHTHACAIYIIVFRKSFRKSLQTKQSHT